MVSLHIVVRRHSSDAPLTGSTLTIDDIYELMAEVDLDDDGNITFEGTIL